MSRGARERLTSAAAAAVLLAGAAVTAGWFHLRTAVPAMSGSRHLPDVREEVRIRSGEFAIPRVDAASEHDLFFAQGWLHASHRLWQMELLRRTARGTLSELFGERALPADRLLRTLDLWAAAGRHVRALPAGDRAALEAYAAGVNAWLSRRDGALPPEFVLLGAEPEPWTPRASAAVGKVMALDLSAWHRELSRYHAARRLPEPKRSLLRPRYPGWGPTVLAPAGHRRRGLGADEGAARSPGREAGGEPARPGPARSGTGDGAAPRGSDPFELLAGRGLGASNSWVVSGRRTRSGRPMVANDMHLDLRAPPVWYVVSLRARSSGLEAAGLSLPGAPGVVVGFNRRVAWTFTNGMVDDMDFAVETVGPEGSRYREDGGWRAFAVRPETIRVRDRDRPVVHRVRETVRGPVVSDAVPELETPLSAQFLARRRTSELRGLLAMNRAGGPEDLDRAIGRFDSPQQNVLWAATDGTVGYRLSGRVPRRPGWAGHLPVAAEVMGEGWPGTWPADSMPAAVFPPGDTTWPGFLASANNLQARDLFGVLGVDYPLPFRARRIVDRLGARRAWTPEGLHRLQHDTWSLLADRLLDRAIAAARRAGEDSAARVMAAWDGRVEVGARGAGVFYAWAHRLRSLVAADEYRATEEWGYFPMGALLRLLEEGREEYAGSWFDDVRTDTLETPAGLEERAIREAARATGLRRWGELHTETQTHPLGRVPWLDRLIGFDVGPHPSPGAPRTVRSDDYRRWLGVDSTSWRPPWRGDYGPSEHLVVELRRDGPAAGVLLPAGQSGVPFDPHYRDMAGRWRSGGPLIPLRLPSGTREEDAGRLLRLLPDASGETPSR